MVVMARRRNAGGQSSSDTGLDSEIDSNHSTTQTKHNLQDGFVRCNIPIGECLMVKKNFGLIDKENPSDVIRVICSNENCTMGDYMHRECFNHWEQVILNQMKNSGRARNWSDKQRQQNVWTKKGYELIYKICVCKCGSGYLKKDMDWVAPLTINAFPGLLDDDNSKKQKKKRNRPNQKGVTTNLSITTNFETNGHIISSGIGAIGTPNTSQILNNCMGSDMHLSESNGGTTSSALVATSSEYASSGICQIMPTNRELLNKQKARIEQYSERVRSTSGCNGIFYRRLDFSSFNLLPKSRVNSFQIKMEDEGNHGNDETRQFILSSLAQNQKSSISCVLCRDRLLVFDRYPLVDGTFFLSPKQYAKDCIEVKYEGRTSFLTVVCMHCLEAVTSDRIVRCKFCWDQWDGSKLILGTMYSYDIFAASASCCDERLTCNRCNKYIFPPSQITSFSEYSRMQQCPSCKTIDTHYVKPLEYFLTRDTKQPPHILAQKQKKQQQSQQQQLTQRALQTTTNALITDPLYYAFFDDLNNLNFEELTPSVLESPTSSGNQCWSKSPTWGSPQSPVSSIHTQYHSSSSKESLWNSTQSSPNSTIKDSYMMNGTLPSSNSIWENTIGQKSMMMNCGKDLSISGGQPFNGSRMIRSQTNSTNVWNEPNNNNMNNNTIGQENGKLQQLNPFWNFRPLTKLNYTNNNNQTFMNLNENYNNNGSSDLVKPLNGLSLNSYENNPINFINSQYERRIKETELINFLI